MKIGLERKYRVVLSLRGAVKHLSRRLGVVRGLTSCSGKARTADLDDDDDDDDGTRLH